MKPEYKAILLDDEPLSLSVIEKYLHSFSEIEIAGKYTRSSEALEKIIQLKPDLLFLDIQMPVMNGFELIEHIVPHHNPYIIFTTAFAQYAMQAFEVNAIGYLLKPIERSKFDAAVQKFLSYKKEKKETEIYHGLERLLAMNPEQPWLEKIMIKDVKKIFFIPVTDIFYFEASGDYVKVISNKGTHLIHESLSGLEQKLSPKAFVRIHRSHLVNTSAVQEFIPHFNGEYSVVMQNGDTLKMSRHYKEGLSNIFTGL